MYVIRKIFEYARGHCESCWNSCFWKFGCSIIAGAIFFLRFEKFLLEWDCCLKNLCSLRMQKFLVGGIRIFYHFFCYAMPKNIVGLWERPSENKKKEVSKHIQWRKCCYDICGRKLSHENCFEENHVGTFLPACLIWTARWKPMRPSQQFEELVYCVLKLNPFGAMTSLSRHSIGNEKSEKSVKQSGLSQSYSVFFPQYG